MGKDEQTLTKDKLEFVSGIITNKQGNVLILRRRDDLKLDPGKDDFCSGHMKEGEIPLQSMYRELQEETGIQPHHVKTIENLGDIETPHEKLKGTKTHLYHIEIDFTEEKINEMIQNMEDPEMARATYVEDIEYLKKMQQETKNFRVAYTKEMELVLDKLAEKISKRKENEKNICQEK